ncbi:MAG: hypothetical protein HGA94_04510, partial [Candidatus Aminicenantes bacterium]|nr:hypothetical protein [Candidatus Aminicenantes bacterium]
MPALPPVRLRCEHLVEPLGVDTAAPLLSWHLESPVRGESPKAVQVLVSSAAELLRNDIGDFWDTGRIDAPPLPALEYRGEALASCARYIWKVRWWDREGAPSPWSEPASFVTGFLYPGDWKPTWIGAREVREFRSKGTVLLGHAGAEGRVETPGLVRGYPKVGLSLKLALNPPVHRQKRRIELRPAVAEEAPVAA